MILGFKSDSIPFFVGIGSKRELSIAAPTTKYAFELVDDLGKYKDMTKGEKVLLAELKTKVELFGSLVDVRTYVISEMSKLSMVFVRELTVEEYEAFVGA